MATWTVPLYQAYLDGNPPFFRYPRGMYKGIPIMERNTLLHVTHSTTGIPHVANPRMRGAVIDYKATLSDLAAQHLELKSAMSGDVRRGDKLYALLAQVERTWVFQFLPRALKNAIADAME